MTPTRVTYHSLQDKIELWLIESKISKKLLHRLFVLGIIWCSATALLIGVYPPNYSPKVNSIAQIHAAVFGSTHEMLAGSRNVIPEAFSAVGVGELVGAASAVCAKKILATVSPRALVLRTTTSVPFCVFLVRWRTYFSLSGPCLCLLSETNLRNFYQICFYYSMKSSFRRADQ